MADERNDGRGPDPGRRRTWNTGLGVALGAAIGAEPIWMAVGAALGTVFGATRFR